MPTVIILLSAYNGERYIEEQLRSLTVQEGVRYKIIVRDDGSSDATPDILRSWQERGDITWYRGENMGWAWSFMHLLTHAPEADYYAFCDHDDIWLPDKLSVAVKMLQQEDSCIKLYCSNLYEYKEGKIVGEVYSEIPVINIYTAMVKAATAGCTMVLSRGLQQKVANNQPKYLFAHDYWVYQVAAATGCVIYDPKPHILYRQHVDNQIGYKSSFTEIWKRRLKQLRTLFAQHQREWAARELLSCHGDEMSDEHRKAVAKMAYYKKNPLRRLSLFFDKRYSMGHFSNNFWLRLRIILGCV